MFLDQKLRHPPLHHRPTCSAPVGCQEQRPNWREQNWCSSRSSDKTVKRADYYDTSSRTNQISAVQESFPSCHLHLRGYNYHTQPILHSPYHSLLLMLPTMTMEATGSASDSQAILWPLDGSLTVGKKETCRGAAVDTFGCLAIRLPYWRALHQIECISCAGSCRHR